jgi:hypothetical protein
VLDSDEQACASATARVASARDGFSGVDVRVAFGAALNLSRPAISINRYVLLVPVGDSRHRQEDGHLVGSNRPSAGVLSDTFLPVPDWPQNGTTLALIPPLIIGRVAAVATAARKAAPRGSPTAPRAVMHMNRFVVSQPEDEWLATDRDRKLVAQNCRDLAKHTPPGEPREQLLEIARIWDIVERSDLVRQHPELARGEQQNEDALRAGFLILSHPL